MKIKFKVIEAVNPKGVVNTIPMDAFEVNRTNIKIPNLKLFRSIVTKLEQDGSQMLSKFFGPLIQDKTVEVNVIATHCISEPYDAWCEPYKDQIAFFFNLGIWTADELIKDGTAVIVHELTHVLLQQIITMPEKNNYVDILEYIQFDEGIAHYAGFTRNYSDLFTKYYKYKKQSEVQFSNVKKELSSSDISKEKADELLCKSNTGNYWDKFAAISGLFNVAEIHNKKGSQGVVDFIINSRWFQK